MKYSIRQCILLVTTLFLSTTVSAKPTNYDKWYACTEDRQCTWTTGVCGEDVCLNQVYKSAADAHFTEIATLSKCVQPKPMPTPLPVCKDKKCTCTKDTTWKSAKPTTKSKWTSCNATHDCVVLQDMHTCSYYGVNQRYQKIVPTYLFEKEKKSAENATLESMTKKATAAIDSPPCDSEKSPEPECRNSRCLPEFKF